MIGNRIIKLEKFFGVKKPKDMNYLDWMENLYEMEQKWKEENNKEFPL